MKEITEHVAFCSWLPLLNMFLRFIHASACIKFVIVYHWVVSSCGMHCTLAAHSPNVWVCPVFVNCEWSFYTHSRTGVCGDVWHMLSFILAVYLGETPNFPRGLNHSLVLPPCVGWSPTCFTSLTELVFFVVFLIHSSGCVSGFSLWLLFAFQCGYWHKNPFLVKCKFKSFFLLDSLVSYYWVYIF